jgi:hypothetical protein
MLTRKTATKVRCTAEVHHAITSRREGEDKMMKAELGSNCTLFNPAKNPVCVSWPLTDMNNDYEMKYEEK